MGYRVYRYLLQRSCTQGQLTIIQAYLFETPLYLHDINEGRRIGSISH
jgi:hypothetical protein